MRVVQRRHTRSHPNLRSTDYDVKSGVDTLTERWKHLKHGETLYPWSRTKLRIANGKRTWVAKRAQDYYDEPSPTRSTA